MNDKPQVEHWCVFGCEAYAHVPKMKEKRFEVMKMCILGLWSGNQRLQTPWYEKIKSDLQSRH